MTIRKELLEELSKMYLNDFDQLRGKTIKDIGTTWDNDCGYIIFDSNEFTILEVEEYYGSLNFGIKEFNSTLGDLTDGKDSLLRSIADFTDFDYEEYNRKLEEMDRLQDIKKAELEREKKYQEYLKLKAEFEA